MIDSSTKRQFCKASVSGSGFSDFRSPNFKIRKMITVLVHYRQWVDAGHALLDGTWVDHSKVVEVFKLTDLNGMFRHITKIDILERS
jgi:hypothetical protein